MCILSIGSSMWAKLLGILICKTDSWNSDYYDLDYYWYNEFTQYWYYDVDTVFVVVYTNKDICIVFAINILQRML